MKRQVTLAPPMRKVRDENGVANNGSYRETMNASVAWDIATQTCRPIPTGSLVSLTSGGFEPGLNATAIRGTLRVGDAQFAVAYLVGTMKI